MVRRVGRSLESDSKSGFCAIVVASYRGCYLFYGDAVEWLFSSLDLERRFSMRAGARGWKELW